MSTVQTLKKEIDDAIMETEKLFNNLGADVETLMAKLQARIDTLKNKVDDHCRNHRAQAASNAGKPIPHDPKPQAQSEANPAPQPTVTAVGSTVLKTGAQLKAWADKTAA